MLNSFIFKNFEPSADLVIHSNRALDRLLDQAPYGSPVFAQIDKIENGYWAAVEIISRFGPFSGRSFSSDPKLAVSKVIDSTLQKIGNWKMGRQKLSDADSWMPHKHPEQAPSF